MYPNELTTLRIFGQQIVYTLHDANMMFAQLSFTSTTLSYILFYLQREETTEKHIYNFVH